MKKQLLTVATLMFATLCVKAQKPDTARMLVHYKFTWVQDTTNRAHPYMQKTWYYM